MSSKTVSTTGTNKSVHLTHTKSSNERRSFKVNQDKFPDYNKGFYGDGQYDSEDSNDARINLKLTLPEKPRTKSAPISSVKHNKSFGRPFAGRKAKKGLKSRSNLEEDGWVKDEENNVYHRSNGNGVGSRGSSRPRAPKPKKGKSPKKGQERVDTSDSDSAETYVINHAEFYGEVNDDVRTAVPFKSTAGGRTTDLEENLEREQKALRVKAEESTKSANRRKKKQMQKDIAVNKRLNHVYNGKEPPSKSPISALVSKVKEPFKDAKLAKAEKKARAGVQKMMKAKGKNRLDI